MALSRSKAFVMLVTPSSVTMHVHAPGTRQHLLSLWHLFDFSSGIETMVSFDGIFHVLPSYVLWAYFITSAPQILKQFVCFSHNSSIKFKKTKYHIAKNKYNISSLTIDYQVRLILSLFNANIRYQSEIHQGIYQPYLLCSCASLEVQVPCLRNPT